MFCNIERAAASVASGGAGWRATPTTGCESFLGERRRRYAEIHLTARWCSPRQMLDDSIISGALMHSTRGAEGGSWAGVAVY